MANLTLNATWASSIYELAQTDPVIAGPPNLATKVGGPNIGLQQLGNRTEWLKQRLGGFGGEAAVTANLDTLSSTGFYEFDGASTGTPASTAGGVIHTQMNSGRATQIAHLDDGKSAQRVRNGAGVWSAWTFLFAGNQSKFQHQTNGYEELPTGMIMQWGRVIYNAGLGATGEVFNLPKAFPNEFLSIVGTDVFNGCNSIGIFQENLYQFRAWGKTTTGAFGNTTLTYHAYGY